MKLIAILLFITVPIFGIVSRTAPRQSDEICTQKDVVFGNGAFDTYVSEFRAKKGSQKILLILPPTGGTNILDIKYANEFCSNGFDVFILNTWTDQIDNSTDLESHQRFYLRGQRAIANVLSEIKSPFIGLLGTSVGALHASIAASFFTQIDAVFTITGGTPLAEVVVRSDQQAMIDLKNLRKKRYGFDSEQEIINAISEVLYLEPTTLGELYKNKDLGMSIGEEDTTVPTQNQHFLKNLWHPKKVISISDNHFFTIIKTWLFYSSEIINFFEQSFRSRATVSKANSAPSLPESNIDYLLLESDN